MQNECIKISERLTVIANLVRKDAVLADVGTDHAFLPIYLLQKGKINSAIAVDVNEKPLKIANQHIESYNLSDKVKTFISNGLEKITPKTVDDIVIAGMGGELISEILNNCLWVKNSRYRLMLQPMTRPEALREFLFRNSFEILEEKCVYEGNKLYIIIVAEYTKKELEYDFSDFYIGRLRENGDENSVLFLKKTLNSLGYVYKGAVINGDSEKIKETEKICRIICDIIGDDVNDYCKRY